MKHLFCEDRLRGLDLLSLEKKRLKEDLINVCTCRYLMAWSKDRARSFSLVFSERTSGHDHKLKHRKCFKSSLIALEERDFPGILGHGEQKKGPIHANILIDLN